jgi:antagonist of KipI
MEVTVIRSGMLTTVQDLGRPGYLAQGVPHGGAADPFALRVANLLVGNPEGAPALEITLIGPELEFSESAWVAVCGAQFEDVQPWRPFQVEAGGRVRFGARLKGCRAYLAVAGGFDIETVMGGKGTFLAAALGGLHGHALRDGDHLKSIPTRRRLAGRWTLDERVLPIYSREPTLRVMAGAQEAQFDDLLYKERFSVTARSNRMGIRLEGAKLLRSESGDLVSSAVAPGTIQVPPDGNPIVLMCDAQTLGGYPRVGHVASVDFPLLAQLAPGDHVRFERTSVKHAHEWAHAGERTLGLLRQGIAEKVKGE